ncbi:hypothetical protein ACFSR7_00580 [Cohnella sp. GCM10020058]|uniref:hypothetical protein n=1 Tax=Cohnella sp. GCM10020058 TaxID=3317330 RepID=UPI0036403302
MFKWLLRLSPWYRDKHSEMQQEIRSNNFSKYLIEKGADPMLDWIHYSLLAVYTVAGDGHLVLMVGSRAHVFAAEARQYWIFTQPIKNEEDEPKEERAEFKTLQKLAKEQAAQIKALADRLASV